MIPIFLALILSIVELLEKLISFFSIFTDPIDGLSIKDKIFNKVDLPDPEDQPMNKFCLF